MRQPEHAASVIAAMTRKVRIPVTVKMRAGWNDEQRNAGVLARLVQDAGASAIAVHGRTAAQSYSGSSDWDFISRVAESVEIPVFGSGDVIEPEQAIAAVADDCRERRARSAAACCGIRGSCRRRRRWRKVARRAR